MLTKEDPLIPLPSPGTQITLHKLAVAYDFTVFSEIALEYAVQLAQEHHSQIVVEHIEHPSAFEADMECGLGAVKAAHTQTEREVRSIAQHLRERGLTSSSFCRFGPQTDMLVQLAIEIRPDLLLLGASGHRRSDAWRLGSTAEFLLRCLPCPALTFGPQVAFANGVSLPGRHLVYASSLLTGFGPAARFAEFFARCWGAELEVLHVIDDWSVHYDSRKHSQMDAKGAALAKEFGDRGIDAQWSVRLGSRSETILERAAQLGADMIIFGIDHKVADSTIDGMINATIQQSVCPVLTVPGCA